MSEKDVNRRSGAVTRSSWVSMAIVSGMALWLFSGDFTAETAGAAEAGNGLATSAQKAFVQGVEAVRSSNINLAAMPSILDVEIKTLFYFATISILSLPIAKYVRLPMPHLLGPLAVSSILHIMGIIALPRINEFLILAQMTIGGIIGLRLASVNFNEIAKYLKDAILSALLVVSAFALMAILTALILDVQFLQMLLAFIPGGFYEVTLLSLIFGFDVAFVAFHHSIRVVLVFLLFPLTISKIHKKV